tara:strand:+ start:18482 stop:18817 length:336 start_codon:yes stop_codon:yes gene_type:complete
MEKLGIENTLEVVTLGASIISAVQFSREDGSINAGDLIHLLRVIPKIGPALDEVEEVPAELADLDAIEREQIFERLREIIGDEGDLKTEAYAVAALKIAEGIYEAVQTARA